MKIRHSSMAHPRLSSAHGPEPLTAPGAAQACPTCLPSPSHQLTFQDDLRPGCPLRKSAPFAPRHSAIGNITGGQLAFSSLPMPVPAGNPLICGVRDVWPTLRPLALAATANPANQLTQEGDLRHGRPLKKTVRFAPRHSSIGDSTGNRPAFILTLLPTQAPVAMNCGHCSGRGALRSPSAIADAAMHRSSAEFSGMIRPFVSSSSGLSAQLRAQRIGGFIHSDARDLPPAPSGFLACPSPRQDESDLPTWLPSPSHTTNATARKTRRTSVSYRLPSAGQRDGCQCLGRMFWHNRPHQGSPRILPMGSLFRSHPAEIRSPKTDSTTWASLNLTAVLPSAFNPMNAFRHPASPDLINPVRRLEVIQDSDFRWKSRIRKKLDFSSVPPGVRRPSERLAAAHQFHPSKPNT